MSSLRFALFGAGFWARYQLAAWREIPDVQCVAIYNRTRAKAERLAAEFAIPQVFDQPQTLLQESAVDFIDIVTDVDTHHAFVMMAAENGLSAICQKPMSSSVASARKMVDACRAAGTRLLVHENWRWQTPIRAVKAALDESAIGRVFRARIQYSNSFPVFENQPFLRELDRFIVSDIGVHLLDVARFLFGEVSAVYCRTARVHPEIRGEDVATVVLSMRSGAAVVVEMSYASRMEHDRFPETFLLVEGELGSLELGPDYLVRTTTASGTWARRYPPPRYTWADPAYDLVHASIVPCHRNLVDGLRGITTPETTGQDNLRTLQLVEAAYASAESGAAVPVADLASEAYE